MSMLSNRLRLSGRSIAASSLLANATLRAGYATSAAAGPAGATPKPVHSSPSPAVAARASGLPALGSIEASWVALPRADQERIYNDLQELQKKDWKELSLDEKKASYYIAYGPHGPRAPIVPPNTNGKVFIATIACMVAAFGIFSARRIFASQETPKTLSKEWKEATDEYAKEQKMNPFTGIARPDGKGHTWSGNALPPSGN